MSLYRYTKGHPTSTQLAYRCWVSVWAKDAQHALKIANEKRAVVLAEEAQGLTKGVK